MVGPPPSTWALDPAKARAFELEPRLWQLRLPAPWAHMTHVNAYAVDHPQGGVVLVDCGCGGHPTAWTALEHALSLAGRTSADVRDIVVTHYHSDHMGLAGPLAAATGATVWAHPDHAHLFEAVHDPEGVYAKRLALAREQGVPEAWQDAAASVAEELDGVEAPPEPARLLRAGAAVDTALGPLEVVETPGHAPNHVCLHQPERGLLFSGDLLGQVFTTYADWGYTPDPIGEYRASIEAVAGLDARLALPGHGRPTDDLGEWVELFRAGMAERLAAVRASRGEGAWAVALDVFGATGGHDAAMVWNYYETLGYLRHAG